MKYFHHLLLAAFVLLFGLAIYDTIIDGQIDYEKLSISILTLLSALGLSKKE